MDLVEDEREGIQKRRSIVQWDAKKKKYVRQTLGLDTLSGSMEGLKERCAAKFPNPYPRPNPGQPNPDPKNNPQP